MTINEQLHEGENGNVFTDSDIFKIVKLIIEDRRRVAVESRMTRADAMREDGAGRLFLAALDDGGNVIGYGHGIAQLF